MSISDSNNISPFLQVRKEFFLAACRKIASFPMQMKAEARFGFDCNDEEEIYSIRSDGTKYIATHTCDDNIVTEVILDRNEVVNDVTLPETMMNYNGGSLWKDGEVFCDITCEDDIFYYHNLWCKKKTKSTRRKIM